MDGGAWGPWSGKESDTAERLHFHFRILFNSLQPHGLQHTRLPHSSLSHRVCSNTCPLSQWCHPSSLALFFSCPQSFPTSGSSPMSLLFASVLPMNIKGWFPLGLAGLISFLSKGLSGVFSSTTVRKQQLFGTQPLYVPTLTTAHD